VAIAVDRREQTFGGAVDLGHELLADALDLHRPTPVADVLDPLGSRAEVEYLRVIARDGTSADRQIRTFERTGHLHAVVDNLAVETLEGVPEVSLA